MVLRSGLLDPNAVEEWAAPTSGLVGIACSINRTSDIGCDSLKRREIGGTLEEIGSGWNRLPGDDNARGVIGSGRWKKPQD